MRGRGRRTHRYLLPELAAKNVRNVLFDRAGMRLLLGNAELRQELDDLP
jgi:hypothetical protein